MSNYDTTIRETHTIKRHNTMHTDWIDWEGYDFSAKEHTDRMCCSKDGQQERLAVQIDYLKKCEQWKDRTTWASDYGGWPRIWQEVIGVGMASAWPYWTPRPVVIVRGAIGVEWIDWMSLTGAKAEGE